MSHGIEVRPTSAIGPRQSRSGSARPGRGAARRPAIATPIASPRDLLYVLFKHRVKALVVALTLFTLAFLAALLLPSKYTSEAQLLVRIGRESLPNSTVAGGPQMMPMIDPTAQVNSEAQIFRAREIVQATVKKVGIERLLNEPAADDATKLAAQEALAQRLLATNIDVQTEPMSQIIKVTYDSTDPQKARDVVQTYVDCYLDHRSRIYGSVGAGNLFEGLTHENEAKLKAIETQIKQLKDQTGVSDVAAQKQILLNRMAGLQTTVDTCNAALAASIKKIENLEGQLNTTPRNINLSRTTREPMGVVSTAENDLNKLKAELDQKLTTYLPESPVILQLQDQIKRAEIRLRKLEQTSQPEVVGLNPTWAELDKQLATERTTQDGLDAQLQATSRELEKAKQGLAIINDTELKMSQLAREQGMVTEQLKTVVEGRNFSTIDQAMGKDRVGSVSTSQAATTPTKPSSPNRKLLMIFGLFTALIGGMGTAFVSEMLDQSVSKPQDLKRLGFTRVVSIPMLRMGKGAAAGEEAADALSPETQAIVDLTEQDATGPAPTPKERLRPTRYVRSRPRPGVNILAARPVDPSLSPREVLQQWKNRQAQPALGHAEAQAAPRAAFAAPVSTPAVLVNPPANRPSLSPRFLEACHALLERLVFSPVATGEFAMPRSIAVVGVTPNQGTSTLAVHLAAAMTDYLPNSETGTGEDGRVLLVDTNLASPALHRMLDVINEPGISEWIKQTGNEPVLGDHVRQTAVAKLDVLTGGVASVGHQPGRWTEAAALSLESHYHCVVLDLPSLARAEASARVAGMCDAAVLVIESGSVNREVVRQATQRLAESGVRLLGVVLNKRTYPIPEALYRWI